MALLGFFGPSRDDVWQRLADKVGGNFFEGGLWLGDSKVRAHVDGWPVTLDTYKDSHGTTFTRFRAPYLNTDNFTFAIYRDQSFDHKDRWTDREDLEVGHAFFDQEFVIKSNDLQKVRNLFSDDKLRAALIKQRDIFLRVRFESAWFNKQYPNGMSELALEAKGEIKDLARLNELYELFGEALHQICRIGVALDRDPGIVI